MFATRLTGTLISSPSASSCDDVPAIMNMALALTTANRAQSSQAHGVVNLNASSFVDLQAVGTGKPCVRATVVCVKTKAPTLLRVTTDDGVGGSVVATIPVSGMYLHETDASKPVKLLEAQGVGVLEFFAAGPQ